MTWIGNCSGTIGRPYEPKGERNTFRRGEADLVARCMKEIARGFSVYVDILERTQDDDEQGFCVDLLGLSCMSDSSLCERVQWYYKALLSRPVGKGMPELVSSWLEEIGDSPEVLDAG